MCSLFAKVGQNTLILLLVNLTGALMGFLLAAALGKVWAMLASANIV